jgi:hypothetical protein
MPSPQFVRTVKYLKITISINAIYFVAFMYSMFISLPFPIICYHSLTTNDNVILTTKSMVVTVAHTPRALNFITLHFANRVQDLWVLYDSQNK